VPEDLKELAEIADAVLIDSRSGAALGGTGTTFSWEAVAPQLAQYRDYVRLVVAGGLTPDNVRHAIELLDPSVVDVSSGVERAPGVKDETLMRAFARAVGVPAK
jgi:phosphoribosylanthranilate isomerase